MRYMVVSLVHDDVVAEGSGVVVSFDYSTREKVALPESVRLGIEELEKK
jgi:acyl-CoA thioesterase FadM